MRFAICSIEGSTLSWWLRLQDEGNEVLVYHYQDGKHPVSAHRNVGRGLVPLASSRQAWIEWGSCDPNTVWFFDCTNAGQLADLLRRTGKLVVGGGGFCDRLESDRTFGEKFASLANIQMPPTKEFSTISAAQSFLKTNPTQKFGDGGWAWKSNGYLEAAATFVGDHEDVLNYLNYARKRWKDAVPCILQERIKGVALSTAQWWNGRTWVGPLESTVEEKKFLNKDKGPATGCSLNLVWFYRHYPYVARQLQWETVGALLRSHNAPPGLYDINAIVNASGAWFLEWTPRLGIDSELTSQRGIENLGEFLYNLAVGQSVDHLFDVDNSYVGVRVSIPPYPTETEEIADAEMTKHVQVQGEDGLWQGFYVAGGLCKGEKGLEVGDPYGLLGAVVSKGTNLTSLCDDIYEFLDEKLDIQNLQFRTDAYDTIIKDLEELDKLGYDLPELEDFP